MYIKSVLYDCAKKENNFLISNIELEICFNDAAIMQWKVMKIDDK